MSGVFQAWNPAVEEQCFDRCHRMGQTKDVIVTKVRFQVCFPSLYLYKFSENKKYWTGNRVLQRVLQPRSFNTSSGLFSEHDNRLGLRIYTVTSCSNDCCTGFVHLNQLYSLSSFLLAIGYRSTNISLSTFCVQISSKLDDFSSHHIFNKKLREFDKVLFLNSWSILSSLRLVENWLLLWNLWSTFWSNYRQLCKTVRYNI